MEYQKKDGEFVCFKKKSQKGNDYWSGEVKIDGKSYWVNVYNNKPKKGVDYLSEAIRKKEYKPVDDVVQDDEVPF